MYVLFSGWRDNQQLKEYQEIVCMLKKIKPNLSVVSHFVSKRTKNGNCEGKVLLVCNGKLAGERKKELAKKTGVPSMELFDLKAALDYLKQLGSSLKDA